MKPVALLLFLALVSCAQPDRPGTSTADWLTVDTTFRDNTVIIERVSYRSANGLRVNGQVCRTTILRRAWYRGQRIDVHGLVYGLSDGLLRRIGLSVTHGQAWERQYAASLQALR